MNERLIEEKKLALRVMERLMQTLAEAASDIQILSCLDCTPFSILNVKDSLTAISLKLVEIEHKISINQEG